ncbi:hypothetical protein BDK51DRAFT_44789 [Blyttiomyces helicus]|uniref:F-box domain-containing protein n=1 Tax=Blyttiomyces helicus TaxID=388810 RepID=A0A4P9WNL6_9FUNG|nr:hypothetical protein BDK51DRAFT_44789 [Blyttiomyces helicus]|eukprot:RKO94082.1 hypothetical protein BDK51DRAFT_44789 [Blyttiomyces helicus]
MLPGGGQGVSGSFFGGLFKPAPRSPASKPPCHRRRPLLSLLSDEILLSTLLRLRPSDLLALRLTSDRLSKVSQDRSLQLTLSLTPPPHSARLTLAAAQEHLKRRKKFAREVDFSVWGLTAGKVAEGVERCKALVSVRLDSSMWLSLKALLDLGSELPSLQWFAAAVSLERWTPTNPSTRPWCPRVTVLELAVQGDTERSCEMVLGGEGSVAAAWRFSIDAKIYSRAKFAGEIVRRMPGLISLRILPFLESVAIQPSGFIHDDSSDTLLAITMDQLNHRFEDLRLETCVFEAADPTGDAFAAAVRKWGKTLRVLDLDNCDRPTRSEVALLLDTCRRLETLSVGVFPSLDSEDMLDLIREYCNVKDLDLRRWPMVLADPPSEDAKPEVPSLRLGLHPSLTTLHIIAEDFPFTDRDVDALILSAPILESVTLFFGPQNTTIGAGLECALTAWGPRLRMFRLPSVQRMRTASGLLALGC